MFGRGGGRGQGFEPRRSRFGGAETYVRLYPTDRGGLRGVVTINGKRVKLFITSARDRAKPNQTHWCALTVDTRYEGGGGGGRGGF